MRIETGRLTMIAADAKSVSTDLAGRERSTETLGVGVPEDRPSEYERERDVR